MKSPPKTKSKKVGSSKVSKLSTASSPITSTNNDQMWAESFLSSPSLIDKLLEDFKLMGCVGEETSLVTCYLVATSRLLDKTLASVITSQSGAGKSMILNSVLKLIPEEEMLMMTRMTPASLYYQAEGRLKHKLFAVGEEVGAGKASHALRCLLSDGYLSNMVTSRDIDSGQMMAKEVRTEGPTSLLTTTTVAHLDEETQSRFIRLSANESTEQTKEILVRQRESRSLNSLEQKYRTSFVVQKHHKAQRLLKSIEVINPFSKELTFRDDLFRFRREQEKYLRLIDTIALLRQRQKQIRCFEAPWLKEKVDYIEVDLKDIQLANELSEKILSITLDELSPPARNLLEIISKRAKKEVSSDGVDLKDYRFNRREIRQWSGWSDFQVRRYLKELHALEYLKAHSGSQGARFEYELLFSGDPAKERQFNLGLINTEKLEQQIKTSSKKTKPRVDSAHAVLARLS